jgi:S1-C subfamily serine protease
MRTALLGGTALLLLGLSASAARADGFIGVQVRKTEADTGVIVQETFKDSPAEKAGLKSGDLIVKINDKDVMGLQNFVATVRGSKPGDVLTLTLYRDGQPMELKVTVGDPPGA